MNMKMKVDINTTKTGLNIRCPVFANDLIRDMPSRKFDMNRKIWHVPLVRMNAQYIIANWFSMDAIEWGLGVKDAIELAAKDISKTREPIPSEYSFKTEPFGHQIDALNYLWSMNVGALFAEQGTGKTKIAIDKTSILFNTGNIKRALIICPTPLKTTWEDEFDTHCPIKYKICVAGSMSKQSHKSEVLKYLKSKSDGITLDVFVVGYDILSNMSSILVDPIKEYLDSQESIIILDESHNVKNPDANRTKNIQSIAQNAKYRLIMTGTPISQNILDLYSQYRILDNSIIGIGSFSAFKSRYVVFGGFENRQVVGFRNVDELAELIKPYTFKITKKEAGLNLPEKLYKTIKVEMDGDQLKKYKEIRTTKILELNDLLKTESDMTIVCKNVLGVYSLLQQVADGFVMYDDEIKNIYGDIELERRAIRLVQPSKNPKIKAMLEVLDTSGQAVIWAKYVESIKMIEEAINDRYGIGSCVTFYGGVSQDIRDDNKKKFLRGESRFFIANPTVGGAGLTLNCATTVVYYDNSFKLIDRLQSEDRCHRIGQRNNVLYVDLVAQNSVDIRILRAIKNKQDLATYVSDKLSIDKGELL